MSRPKVGDLIPLWKDVPAPEPAPWVRPPDWLPLPEVKEGDQKVVGLHAVFDHDSNFVAFEVRGDYTVDWGDGTVTHHASGTNAYHKFDYADFEGTECSRGYRQAIVTITPQVGQDLTGVHFPVRHNQAGLNNQYSTGWLDVAMAGEHISRLTGPTSGSVGLFYRSGYPSSSILEQFALVGAHSVTNMSYMFRDCSSLQSVLEMDTSNVMNMSYMFYGCSSLQSVPELDTSSVTNMNNMFRDCSSLQSIPEMDTSNVTNMNSMFYGCSSLQSADLDTGAVTNIVFMFGTTSISTNAVSLSKLRLRGLSVSTNINNARLSRGAIVQVFHDLADVADETITLTGNWGALDLTPTDRAIATDKGWTIAG